MELKAGSAIRSFDQEGFITKEPAMRKLVNIASVEKAGLMIMAKADLR
ncbi:hypothetical protein MHO82_22960 [Vibrio sp. Of7-15]|nr:hypothetical protein [Vibrio sp. Of7-15]MCG7499730.1 hypothetical protein [Vibrio sp. Of7-15]